jgi:hypothetical protein
MLKCYITDEDLKAYHPNLLTQLYPTQTSYARQIAAGFNRVVTDLRARGVNPRLCMTQVDLIGDAADTTDNPPLKSRTYTTAVTGSPIECGFRQRFVVVTSTVTKSWVLKLQGCNRIDTPEDDDPAWQDIPGASITSAEGSGPGTLSVVFHETTKWVRLIATPTGVSPSITLTAHVVESVFDAAICHATFALMFSDFAKDAGDMWDLRRVHAETAYEAAIASVKFVYDADADGRAGDGDDDSVNSSTIQIGR